MTSGPATPGAGGESGQPDDPAPKSDQRLPRRAWGQRDVETVIPDEFVEDTEETEISDDDALRSEDPDRPARDILEPGSWWKINAAPPDAFIDLIGDRETPPESRYLRAEAPESVKPGERFAIGAQLLCGRPAEGMGVDLRPFLVPVEGRQVAIDLHVAGGLTVLSDSTGRLTIYPAQDSDPVRFELESKADGPATITLRAFALPSDFLGQLQFTLPVTAAVSGSHRVEESAALQLPPSTERSATLEVDVDASQRLLSFRLRGPGEIGVQRPVTVPLGQAVDEIALGLQRKLDQIAKGTAWPVRAVEILLQSTGADLWDRLLPKSIKDLLLRNLPHLDSLVIIGADDPIPWELLFPVSPGRPPTFLSDEILVSRWAFGALAPRTKISAGENCYVLPASAPPAALTEIEQIEAMLGAGKRIGTLDALLDEIQSPSFGLLHFAAHNIVAGDLPASAWVKLDQPFQQGMLGPQFANRFENAAPLVFMNACNSGATSPLWVGSTGWAGRFLAAGAGAFVGSLWQVRAGPARDFASGFYAELKNGKTLGEAFQEARRQVSKAGDPTRLGYTLFGNTVATIATIVDGGKKP